MHLLVAATQKEMDAFNHINHAGEVLPERLVSGVGPMEAGITMSRMLERHHTKIRSVVNFGIGGAYIPGSDKQPDLLDICVAEREVLGDLGVCYGDEVEPFEGDAFPVQTVFNLDRGLLQEALSVLEAASIAAVSGTFVTVNGASGRKVRGDFLAARYQAICENMEGAAVARACELFDVPLVEVRAISNLVEDRPGNNWLITEAADRAARAAALIVKRFQDTK